MDLHLLLGRRKPPSPLPPAGQKARLLNPSHRRRQSSGFLDSGTQSCDRSGAGKLLLSLSGALTVPPPKGQAGGLAHPTFPGTVLSPRLRPRKHSRPIAFLITPNQNCIPGAGGIPPTSPFGDNTTEARDGVTCPRSQSPAACCPSCCLISSGLTSWAQEDGVIGHFLQLGCWRWPAGVSMVENTCVS